MTNDRLRTRQGRGLRPVQVLKTFGAEAHWHSAKDTRQKGQTIAADKVADRTWLGRWWDGEKWQFIKAPRCPRVTAKFLSREGALTAASQLHLVNKK